MLMNANRTVSGLKHCKGVVGPFAEFRNFPNPTEGGADDQDKPNPYRPPVLIGQQFFPAVGYR